MSNLLANGHTLLSGVLFDSDRKGIVYLNDIQFEPPTPGLFTLFDDHLHVQVNRWGNTQLSTTFSEPFAGQNAIKAEFPMAWEGFSLRQTQRVSTDEFGALTFAVKGNQSGQDLLVYAIDEDEDIVGTAVWASDYIHGGVLPTDWQVAWIPLRDLMPGGGDFNGIAVEPSVAGTVWLDEVKVREEFKMPLPGGKSWLLITETGDTGCYGSSPPTASHIDSNYFSLDFDDRSAVDVEESNVPILASASGRVVFAGSGQYNGTYVIINHDYEKVENQGTGLETFYLHMVEGSLEVETGDLVTRGQPLGILGGTPNYEPHIHIGFFYDYNGSSNVSMLNVLLMEGLKLDEYVNSCVTYQDANGKWRTAPTSYFPSTQ
jgi:hypothetical protein